MEATTCLPMLWTGDRRICPYVLLDNGVLAQIPVVGTFYTFLSEIPARHPMSRSLLTSRSFLGVPSGFVAS